MDDQLEIHFIDSDFPIGGLDNLFWDRAKQVQVTRYWSGEPVPNGRQFTARLLWSDEALYVKFEALQHEPLVITDKPDLTKKTIGLWGRDVCEIFVAPDPDQSNKYYEFEIAPTGEWLDVAIEVLPERRAADWDYSSGMTVASRIESERFISAIRIPWLAFDRKPSNGDEWLGNLFRCVGKDPTRGYLAWQPTLTKEPAFHIPEKFGVFLFTG